MEYVRQSNQESNIDFKPFWLSILDYVDIVNIYTLKLWPGNMTQDLLVGLWLKISKKSIVNRKHFLFSTSSFFALYVKAIQSREYYYSTFECVSIRGYAMRQH